MPKIESPHDYQDDAINDIFHQWFSLYMQNVLCVAPTGAGKTIIKAFVVKRLIDMYPRNNIIVFAHRDILLNQISMALAEVGIPHRLLCSRKTERTISEDHMEELGESFLSDKSNVILASVPTWIKRETKALCQNTCAWLMDESHHLLRNNMWGEAVGSWQQFEPTEEEIENWQVLQNEFPKAFGLGVTATPKRADKKGLGRLSDGIFDVIVKTPGMGELIQRGRLSNYKVYTPPDNIDMTGINVTASGDYNQTKLAKATDKIAITGDAIKHYHMYAKGKQGIVFAASIKHSDHVAEQFRKAGVNAVSLSSKSNDTYRRDTIRLFRQGKIDLLVNYDLFGEGFDVPNVTVVIMLRKTLSYSLFKQMFGRCLRVLAGKEYGILIDHVGNVQHHCCDFEYVHDDPVWTLDRYTERKTSDNFADGAKTRTCPKCRYFYLPKSKHWKHYKCPECGHQETEKEINDAAEEFLFKQGVLIEYKNDYHAKVIGKIKQVDEDPDRMRFRMRNASPMIVNSAVKKHKERRAAQKILRQWIVDWCNETGWQQGLSIANTQAAFSLKFKVDIFRAQTLSKREAEELTDQIRVSMLDNFLLA